MRAGCLTARRDVRRPLPPGLIDEQQERRLPQAPAAAYSTAADSGRPPCAGHSQRRLPARCGAPANRAASRV